VSSNKIGYQIKKIPKKNDSVAIEFSMEAALQRCVYRGLNVKTVIDVGVSDGRWSAMCLNYLPEAKYLLFEPQEPHQIGLDRLKK
jgi:hypothetical protein